MRARLVLGVAVAALCLASSCRDPTEITLLITSNTCGTLTKTGIAVGTVGSLGGFSAVQAGCARSGYVGTIVVLSSGSLDDAVGIEVVGGLGKDPSSCVRGDPQCIVARRSLRYLPHTPLTLPIALEVSCAGVACDDPSTTCVSGACVPSTVDPNACINGGCTLDGGVVDAAPSDASPPDAAVPDASTDAGSTVTVLASSQSSPVGIHVDATDVYWTNAVTPGGSVMRCAKAGCAQPTTVAANQPGAFDVTGDATNVYWTNFTGSNDQVGRALKPSGPVVALATGLSSAYGIATGNGLVYWTHNLQPAGSVLQCLTGGCNNFPTILASSQNGAGGIAVDASHAYWTNIFGGQVMACSLPGCTAPVALASGQGYPELVALDATNVYWTNYTGNTVVSCSKTGCANPTVIASNQSGALGIAVDGVNVYWTTTGNGGTVMKCAKSGCVTPTTLASIQGTPYRVAVDATSVYWTVKGAGTVLKLTPK